MKTFEEIKKTIQLHKEELHREFGIREIDIFGSYIRGGQADASDIDILNYLNDIHESISDGHSLLAACCLKIKKK